MDRRLQELARARYGQSEYLKVLFELALEDNWHDLQHMIQHDMAKAILADYSQEQGLGYLNEEVYFDFWEEVIEEGWRIFCLHTGLSREKVETSLAGLRDK